MKNETTVLSFVKPVPKCKCVLLLLRMAGVHAVVLIVATSTFSLLVLLHHMEMCTVGFHAGAIMAVTAFITALRIIAVRIHAVV